MKRILAILAIILMLSGVSFAAEQWFRPCPEQTASGLIAAGNGLLGGIFIANDGTNAITLDIYDSASGISAIKLIPTTQIPASSTSRATGIALPSVRYFNGAYVVVTTAGTTKWVGYYFAE